MTKGENGEPIQSTGTAFANIGVIVIDDATKKIESNSLFEIKEDTAKDATVAAAAQKIIDRIDKEYGAVFAKSEVELNGAKAPNGNRDSETNNGDLITDAMVWKILQDKESLTVDADHVVAVTNGGGASMRFCPSATRSLRSTLPVLSCSRRLKPPPTARPMRSAASRRFPASTTPSPRRSPMTPMPRPIPLPPTMVPSPSTA